MTAVDTTDDRRAAAERRAERIRVATANYVEAREQIMQTLEEVRENNDHEVLGYRSWTEYVSELFSDAPLMRLTRDERRTIVADLTEQGMSSRAIAPIVGVTAPTVQADIRSGKNLPTGQPRTVTSRDGKVRTVAPKPARPSSTLKVGDEVVDPATGEVRTLTEEDRNPEGEALHRAREQEMSDHADSHGFFMALKWLERLNDPRIVATLTHIHDLDASEDDYYHNPLHNPEDIRRIAGLLNNYATTLENQS